MFEELNEQLEINRQGMNQCQRMDVKLTDYHKQLTELEDKKSDLESLLSKEVSDYENLSRKNLSNLLLEFLNKKEDKERKEYQEVLAARLKLEEAEKQIESIRSTIKNLRSERAELSGCERRFHELYERKYTLLMDSSPENGEKIKQAEDTIHSLKKTQVEIEEALSAGKSVLASVQAAKTSLDHAHGWGTWDLLGGGLISDAMKHSHLEEAQSAINDVQSLLHRFHSELSDIQLDESVTIQIEGFTKFADFFFDGLLADWMVQSKINTSLENVNALKAKVERVLDKLNGLKRNTESSLTHTKAELNSFVENS